MKETVLATAFRSELVFALDLLEETGRVAAGYFDSGVQVTQKEDGSPVTKADKEIEQMIRDAIGARFPDDGILGEEEAEKKAFFKSQDSEDGLPKVNRRWIVDPIDGTFNFARGIPIFSILIAFEENDDIVAGAILNPITKDMFWAERGKGAFKNGERLQVSDVDAMHDSLLTFGAPNRIIDAGLWDNFTNLVQRTYRQRGFGDYLGFALVFEGKAEAAIEVGVKPWDLAPMKILVEEAGGLFLDLAGGHSIYQGSCVIGNKNLAREFARTLMSGPELDLDPTP
jgi:histidinol-phosphatase